MPRITPNLWFDTEAEEAAKFYCSVFPNSEIRNVSQHTEAGPGPTRQVPTGAFALQRQGYTVITRRTAFTLT